MVETEDQFNDECHKALASRSEWHGYIAVIDTCRTIFLTTNPENCDGWTQQIVDRNKKCCGAKSGHLGHLFEPLMASERRIKELANIEKLKVAEITLQEAKEEGPVRVNPRDFRPWKKPTLVIPFFSSDFGARRTLPGDTLLFLFLFFFSFSGREGREG